MTKNPVINSRDQEPDWALFGQEIRKIVLGRSPGDNPGEKKKPMQLTALPPDLRERFPNLTHLYLWGIKGLRTLPPLPPQLECLDVRGCQELGTLPELPASLRTLDVGQCVGLRQLPSNGLPALRRLYLDGSTSLRNFAPCVPILDSLVHLELSGCHFDDLPDFLLGEPKENVLAKVRDHFRAISLQGAAELPECKIVVLGNGGVGKTCLVRALKGRPHLHESPATEGIRLWSWDADGFQPFPKHSQEKVQLNIWDFGGQDLYHNTHRLFLETRAVFLVVWRQPRKDGAPFRDGVRFQYDPIRPLGYWVEQVRSANPEAQILIVRTGMDEDLQEPPGNWRAKVTAEVGDIPTWEVSARERGVGQLAELKTALREAVVKELCSPEAIRLGRGRRAVRDELRKWQPVSPDEDVPTPDSERPIMRFHEFLSLTTDVYKRLQLEAPTEAESWQLLDYLHHCGAVYSPPSWRPVKELQGAFPIVVDQRWAIDAIYKLFTYGEAHDQLVSAWGQITRETLETEFWQELKDGTPRYDATAQWVFVRFMLQCGILVSRDSANGVPGAGGFLIPEFLPDYKTQVAGHEADLLIALAKADNGAHRFVIRHSSLGQGFGCLLVGLLARLFGKSPLYRYGGLGWLKLDRLPSSGRGRNKTSQVAIKLEWYKEKEDVYAGDLVLHILGSVDDDAIGQILQYVESQLREISSFPEEACFNVLTGGFPKTMQTRLEFYRRSAEHRPEVAMRREPPRPIPRLGTIGISTAGEDQDNPNIELYPRVMAGLLKEKLPSSIAVNYYRTDKENRTIQGLISDVASGDMMVAFISRKYLDSPYCMVELLKAAERYQPKATFGKNSAWPHHLHILHFPDVNGLLDRGDQAGKDGVHEAAAWKEKWVDRGSKYRTKIVNEYGDFSAAKRGAPEKYPQHDWMIFAERSKANLGLVLAAISQARNSPLPPLDEKITMASSESLAKKHLGPTADSVVQKVNELVGQLSPQEKLNRLIDFCLKEWQAGRKDVAADCFEDLLQHDPDEAVRKDALERKKLLKYASLEPVRLHWLDKQGK
jgi:hypothetical protein